MADLSLCKEMLDFGAQWQTVWLIEMFIFLQCTCMDSYYNSELEMVSCPPDIPVLL